MKFPKATSQRLEVVTCMFHLRVGIGGHYLHDSIGNDRLEVVTCMTRGDEVHRYSFWKNMSGKFHVRMAAQF